MTVSKKEKQEKQELPVEEAAPQTEQSDAPQVNEWEEKYKAEHDQLLRLAAEFDNFRKRTVKEKDAAYGNGRADTVAKMLPVYDNLERALKQETADEAYKKGVELTMNELLKIFGTLGVELFGEVGDSFDPEKHNAIMHNEDESLGENIVSMVFQKGFRIGEKVVRFAMVQVAN